MRRLRSSWSALGARPQVGHTFSYELAVGVIKAVTVRDLEKGIVGRADQLQHFAEPHDGVVVGADEAQRRLQSVPCRLQVPQRQARRGAHAQAKPPTRVFESPVGVADSCPPAVKRRAFRLDPCGQTLATSVTAVRGVCVGDAGPCGRGVIARPAVGGDVCCLVGGLVPWVRRSSSSLRYCWSFACKMCSKVLAFPPSAL